MAAGEPHAANAGALVIAPDGRRCSFGDFVDQRRRISGKSVTLVAKEAGISRANYYLLEKNKQRPSLPTAISLLRAVGLEASVPREDDPDLNKDLDVQVGDESYKLEIAWSYEDRRASRQRLWSNTNLGIAAATGLGAAAMGVGIGGLPLGAPIAATVLALRLMQKGHAAQQTVPASKDEVLADFVKTAEDMSTEDLEALLAAMKAMRDEHQGTGEQEVS